MKTLRLFVVLFTLVLILVGFGSIRHIVSDNRQIWTGFDKSHLASAYCATIAAFGLMISWLLYELHVLRKKLGIVEDESREKNQKQDIVV